MHLPANGNNGVDAQTSLQPHMQVSSSDLLSSTLHARETVTFLVHYMQDMVNLLCARGKNIGGRSSRRHHCTRKSST